VITPTPCQSKEDLERYFNSICIEQSKGRRAAGVVIRDPNAWYFQENAFFIKKPFGESIIMKESSGSFKW
jgi:hypothetical protein